MSDLIPETPATEQDPIDVLTIRLEKQTRELDQLKERCTSLERGIEEILKVMKKGEELFELRSSRVLYNVLNGLTHSLEHSIEAAQDSIRMESQGFDIKVVDGEEVKEGPHTIIVTKKGPGNYDFAAASAPDLILNDNTEPFVEYFEKYPEVFGDRTELLVNIAVLQSALPVEGEG